jgi:hypothetical protein
MEDRSGPVRSRRQRVVEWIHAHRWWLLAGWLVHAVVIHALFLGIPSWDGFAYRIPPAIELVQHHDLGLDRYWAFPFTGFVPFAELAQVPLLAALGLPGLLITGPLILFPLCVVAVYKLGRTLSGHAHGGTFAALAYVAIPMINEQPYTGYVDYLVSAGVAYLVYAVLELRDADRRRRAAVRVIIATALVTLTKPTGLYICALLSILIFLGLFVERDGRRLRLVRTRVLGISIAAMAIGALPTLAIQIIKVVHYGSPIYPFQFNLLGHSFGSGLPAREMFAQSGLTDDTLWGYGRNFVHAWIWPEHLPFGFYGSSFLGGGWVLMIALALVPAFVRSATRFEKWLAVSCVIVSVLARDFWYPRWSYTLIVAICIVIGRALPELARAPRGRWRFWVAGGLLLLHFTRPEYNLWQLRHPSDQGPRIDVIGSPWFRPGPGVLEPVPDVHARFVIVDYVPYGFLVPLYGQQLTNEVVYTVPRGLVGPRCAGLRFLAARDPTVLFVDDFGYTKNCRRVCAVTDRFGWCHAWQLFPADRQ